ncbi:MAG: agmatine deiminase family protein [Deltaproteobacteria bacterium]|nr:agmatine deiminase family protein [Deltaproteobacteria bacterium]
MTHPASTPIPPEWAPHRAVWLAWPAHPELWGEALPEVQETVRRLAHYLAELPGSERIEMVVRDAGARAQAAAALAGLDHRLHELPYGDIWLRDTAPIFRGASRGAVAFTFDGWGGKYRLPGDAELAVGIAGRAGEALQRDPLVLEGGAVDGDGEGTVLTTRQCALNPNRNPGLGEAEVEARIASLLGARKVIWLDEGLSGDHTDGHVDNLARFVAPARVACGRPAPGDPNTAVLEAIIEALRAERDAEGRSLEPVLLPSPGLVPDEEGAPSPATHLNFLVGNRRVVVPTFGGASDAEAIEILADCFPGREVVGLDARVLLPGGGAIHCISQQEPA